MTSRLEERAAFRPDAFSGRPGVRVLLTALASLAAGAGLALALEGSPKSAGIAMAILALLSAIAFCAWYILAGFARKSIDGQRRMAESEQRFRRAMQDSPIGVAIVALDGRLVETNRAFADLLGYTIAELERKSFFEITHPDDLAIGGETMTTIRAGKADTYSFEKRYLRKDGAPVWARLTGSVIFDDQTGAPLYLVSQVEDIDARKKAEARLLEAETRWNFALASAGQGVWDVDLRNGTSYCSPVWKQILGYEPHELDERSDPDLWLKLIHPEDRPRVFEADKAHREGNTPFYEAEFRMRHKSGHWVWILDRGKTLERDEQGRAIRAIGTHTDITRLKESEQKIAVSAALLADEKERLRVTLRSIGDAVICTDAGNRITFMNPVAEALTGVAGELALGKDLCEVYRCVDEETAAEIGGLAIRTGAPQAGSNARAVLLRADGGRCSIREVVSPILTDGQEFAGSVIVFQDFTDARTLQRDLAYAAAHDALTGLPNRSRLVHVLEAAIGEAREGCGDQQFMFLDLDAFKAVNDTSGHAAGDALLKEVAATLRGLLRPGDFAARLGGDEFAILLKECSPELAAAQAQALVEAVAGMRFAWGERRHSIGASIGLTRIGAGAEDAADVIARADEACYAAKNAGRGRAATFEAIAAERGLFSAAS